MNYTVKELDENLDALLDDFERNGVRSQSVIIEKDGTNVVFLSVETFQTIKDLTANQPADKNRRGELAQNPQAQSALEETLGMFGLHLNRDDD